MNHELPDVQAGFRKGIGTRDQIANIRWIIEKAREFQKNTYFYFIDYAKAFDCVDHNKLWKILKWKLEKAEEPEIKLPTSTGSSKKQESSRKTSTSSLLTIPKLFTVWITTNSGKFLKIWEYQTTWPASWEICMQIKKQQLELDMEQQTSSK